MPHLGRPGPWTLFRDLIGPKSWSRERQPYKRYQLLTVGMLGDVLDRFHSQQPMSEPVDYTPGDEDFSYTWRTVGDFFVHAARLTALFRWEESGTVLAADIEIESDQVSAGFTMLWEYGFTFDSWNPTDYNLALIRSGGFTTNSTLVNLNPVDTPLTHGLQMRPATWDDPD